MMTSRITRTSLAAVILLDTNALLWTVGNPDRLGPAARQLLTDAPAVYSSPVSLFEISIKSTLGKLTVPAEFAGLIREQGIRELPLSHAHA